jgi:hypothetical protein
VEPQAILERPERGVELHPETAVDLHRAGIVEPGHPEDDLPLGFAQPADQAVAREVRVLVDDRSEAGQHLVDGLMEFLLTGVAARHLVIDVVQLRVQVSHVVSPPDISGTLPWVRAA